MVEEQDKLDNEEQALGVGQQLQRAREDKKITIEQAASDLKVTKEIITYLESEQWHRLYGRTYARGYLANYLKYLGLPQNVLLATFSLDYQEHDDIFKRNLLPVESKGKHRGLYIILSVFLILLIVTAYVYSSSQEISNNVSENTSKDAATAVFSPTERLPQPLVNDEVEVS